MNKIINYEFNKTELQSKIQQLQSERFKDTKLINQYQSEINEYPILQHLNRRSDIISIEYIRDYTEGNRKGKLSREEFKQNTMNCVGVDLLVETIDRWIRTDVKVLKYYEKSRGKIYNGGLNEKYGVDNFVFQTEGRYNQLGWSWNRYKQTDELVILIPQVKRIYTFNYRNLTKFISDKLKVLTIHDCIIYGKDWNNYSRQFGTREVCISIPMEEIPPSVIISIEKID